VAALSCSRFLLLSGVPADKLILDSVLIALARARQCTQIGFWQCLGNGDVSVEDTSTEPREQEAVAARKGHKAWLVSRFGLKLRSCQPIHSKALSKKVLLMIRRSVRRMLWLMRREPSKKECK